jgi:hypothetical protein
VEWRGWPDFLGNGRTPPRRVARRKWFTFSRARAFVRSLKLAGKREFDDWCHGKRPDLPTVPEGVRFLPHLYGPEWYGWGDFLGTGRGRRRKYKATRWVSFRVARDHVHRLSFPTAHAYREYCAGRRPEIPKPPGPLPSNPNLLYAGKWSGWGDFLGNIASEHTPRLWWKTFAEARKLVRRQGLQSIEAYGRFRAALVLKQTQARVDIPAYPQHVYAKEWAGWPDFLGESMRSRSGAVNWRSFSQARLFVQALGLRTMKEFAAYCAGDTKGYPAFTRLCVQGSVGRLA